MLISKTFESHRYNNFVADETATVHTCNKLIWTLVNSLSVKNLTLNTVITSFRYSFM